MTSKFEIAFTNTIDFSGPDDDVTDRVIDTVSYTRGMEPYERIAGETVMTVTLWNGDGAFSPENAASIGLRRGLVGRLTLDGTVACVGIVDRVDPAPFAYGARTARVTFRWTKKQISNALADFPLLHNVTTDEVIRRVIVPHAVPPNDDRVWRLGLPGASELGVTTRLPDINNYLTWDTGVFTHPIVGHTLKKGTDGTVNLYRVLRDVLQAEMGYLYHKADGRWHFINRNNWDLNETVVATYDNSAQAGVYATPASSVVNAVTVTAEIPPADPPPYGPVWSLRETITLAANEQRSWTAELRSGGEWISVEDIRQPQANDLTVTDGSANAYVTPRNASEMVVTIVAGPIGATVTGLVLTGKPLDTEKVTVAYTDEESVANNGLERVALKLPVVSRTADADTVARRELAIRNQTAGTFGSVTLTRSLFGTDAGDILDRDVGDAVRVLDSHTGHDRVYRITRVDVELDTRSGQLRGTFSLMPSPYGAWFELDESELGSEARLR